MKDNVSQKILFSDHFAVDGKSVAKALREHGAFDVSLLADLPLFIDPFLLFNSKKEEYQNLHQDIIRYLTFLRDRSVNKRVTPGLLDAWYMFTEVRQTWLGFTSGGNRGHGLGSKFAQALNTNLYRLFSDEEEQVTVGKHLEKLCLLGVGVGKDSISDFTTNLISGYLAEYTQEFAKAHLMKEQCATFYVEKARFNYETEVWEHLSFYLPRTKISFPKPKDDYVLLVPRDLLTRDDTWINQNDLIKSFSEFRNASGNESLRDSISNYFLKRLPDAKDNKQYRKAVIETINQFPVLVDYYIGLKEATGDKAVASSNTKVAYAQALFLENFTKLAALLFSESQFYQYGFITFDESIKRATCLKRVIENEGGYRFLYNDIGTPLTREEELAIAYRFIWFNTPDNGKATELIDPRKAIPVHFKLASNKTLHTFFNKKSEDAIKSKNKMTEAFKEEIIIVLHFSEEERRRAEGYIKEVSEDIGYVTLIDASKSHRDEAPEYENNQAEGTVIAPKPIDKINMSEPTRVFISYSHDQDVWRATGQDPQTQRNRVFDLAERLRGEGVESAIDQHIANPPEGWPRWMMNQVENADFVLVVATETYNRRFRGQEDPNKGFGAQWEGAVISQELYNTNGKNEKFIPITFDTADASHIPLPLQSVTHYNVSDTTSYDELYYYLTHQPPYTPRPLGPIRSRPPRS